MLRGLGRRRTSVWERGTRRVYAYLRSETTAQYGKMGLWKTEGAFLTRDGRKVPGKDRF
jgi:hypothetical protein